MLMKTITYKNPFTDMEITEVFYFHISKADLVRMEMEEHKERFTAADGTEYSGMQAKLHRIVEAEDGKAMMPIFEDIIHRSYGRKDGDRFVRTAEIWQDFKGSGAFDELLFELCTNAEKSADFVNSIFPGNLEQIAAEISREAAGLDAAEAVQAGPNREQRRAAKKKPAAKKAAGSESQLSDAAIADLEHKMAINNATPEAPVALTTEDIQIMSAEDLQAGLADKRFTL